MEALNLGNTTGQIVFQDNGFGTGANQASFGLAADKYFTSPQPGTAPRTSNATQVSSSNKNINNDIWQATMADKKHINYGMLTVMSLDRYKLSHHQGIKHPRRLALSPFKFYHLPPT